MRKLRYAGYVRVSDPRQKDGYSLDAQEAAIKKFVEQHDGLLVNIYVDGGISGTSTKGRDDFNQMRTDARRGAFDVLVVQKFDRLARNRLDAATTKMMLRKDCGIKVLSASGEPSADTDPITGALVEMIMEAMAEWFSINLGQEVRKGRLEMLDQKKWYGGAPYGYRRDSETSTLVPVPDEAAVVIEIFEIYAAGGVGTGALASMLNERGLQTRQYERKGGQKWTRNSIRRILNSRVYLGELPHQPTSKDGSGKRTFGIMEWTTGTHEPLVSQKLFDQCQKVMRLNTFNHKHNEKNSGRYLLEGMCFCAVCQQRLGADHPDARMSSRTRFGKKGQSYSYYICKQDHGSIRADRAEAELLDFLLSGRLITDIDGKDRTVAAIAADQETLTTQERIEEIRTKVARLDFRWDNGAFTGDPQEFLAERQKLEDEITILQARIDGSHEYALSVLNNFPDHWAATADFWARQRLVKAVIGRVIVLNRQVMGVTVRPSNEVVFLRGDTPGRAGLGMWPLPNLGLDF